MNTKLLRNLGIASVVVIVTIFGIGFVEQQEQKSNSLENQIDSWIECRNNPNALIQESYPATCVLGEDRFKQPIISSNESQWQECISRDDVIIVDETERPDRCITPDDVVYVEP